MQIGIVTAPSQKTGGVETCYLGFIDWKNPPKDKFPSVIISWSRTGKTDYGTPKLDQVFSSYDLMGSVGSILSTLHRLKEKKNKETGKVTDYLTEPCNLIWALQQQPTTKICVWDPRVNSFVTHREARSEDEQFKIYSATNNELLFLVTADDEERAKVKAMKRMAEDSVSNPKWAQELAAWVGKPKLERKSGVKGDPPTIVPLSAYSRRSADKKKR